MARQTTPKLQLNGTHARSAQTAGCPRLARAEGVSFRPQRDLVVGRGGLSLHLADSTPLGGDVGADDPSHLLEEFAVGSGEGGSIAKQFASPPESACTRQSGASSVI